METLSGTILSKQQVFQLDKVNQLKMILFLYRWEELFT